MTSPFTSFTPRFKPNAALANFPSELGHPQYVHIGPGYYKADDPCNPSLAQSVSEGYFPSMHPLKTERHWHTLQHDYSELNRETNNLPVYPNIYPGCYDISLLDRYQLLKNSKNRDPDKSVFLLSPNSPRVAQVLSNERAAIAAIPNRFDHVREAELAWSNRGGKLPTAMRPDAAGHKPETVREEQERLASEKIQSHKTDEALRRRVDNIHKYGVPVNTQDAIEDTTMSQHGLYQTIMLETTKRKTACGSVFNSEVPKMDKCAFDLKTEMQFDEFKHIGPGHYNAGYENRSIRCSTEVAAARPSAAFASKKPRFGRRARRLVTKSKNSSQLAKEVEAQRRQKERIQKLYEMQSNGGSMTTR